MVWSICFLEQFWLLHVYNPPYYLSEGMSVVFYFLIYNGNGKDKPNGTLFLLTLLDNF